MPTFHFKLVALQTLIHPLAFRRRSLTDFGIPFWPIVASSTKSNSISTNLGLIVTIFIEPKLLSDASVNGSSPKGLENRDTVAS